MASPLVHEKVWFEKCRYDDAEKLYYEKVAKPAKLERITDDPTKPLNLTNKTDLKLQKFKIEPSIIDPGFPVDSLKTSCNNNVDNIEKEGKEKKEKKNKANKKGKAVLEETKIDGIAAMTTNVESRNIINLFENKISSLDKVVEDMRNMICSLETRVRSMENTLKSTVPPTAAKQNVPAVKSSATKPQKEEEEEDDDDDDDDVDLFGSDSEEESEEAKKVKEERLAQYAAKKAKKPALIAKSSIVLDVKPWDDETDMEVMEKSVRAIQMDGLLWGASKLVPLAYGIRKLQISCVVEDDKVSIDLLQENIQEIEDLVQSVDIAAFNKI